MLDEKDLQAIAALMDAKLEKQKKEIIGEVDVMIDTKIRASEGRMMVMMESYFDPKFELLSEQIASKMESKAPLEVIQDLDDRITTLEDDVHQLKKAQ